MFAELIRGLPAVLDVDIEYERGSMIKRRRDGTVDFVSPLPCPYAYGSTDIARGGDGDPLDVVVIGRALARGRVMLPVQGVFGFIDDGLPDHKVVCAERAPSLGQRLGLHAFFTAYAAGKRMLARSRGAHGPTLALGYRARAGFSSV